jgi:hypothetical protein
VFFESLSLILTKQPGLCCCGAIRVVELLDQPALNLDVLCCFLRFRSLGEGYREQPFFEARLDLIGIDPLGHLKGALR